MKIPFLSERKFCFFGEKETLNSIEDFLKGGDLEYKKVLYSPSLAISCNQCDQIERFWKFFATNLLIKLVKIFGNFLAILKCVTF